MNQIKFSVTYFPPVFSFEAPDANDYPDREYDRRDPYFLSCRRLWLQPHL
jgi:hypothetical protein